MFTVRTKTACVYNNALYKVGEEFMHNATKKEDLPDYVEVIAEFQEEVDLNPAEKVEETPVEEKKKKSSTKK